LKLKGESEAKEKDQPCEDVRKSKNKLSQKRKRWKWAKKITRLYLTIIGIIGDSAKRSKKKIGEKKGNMRKE